ncbi:MAG: GUN4 N-terminal ARM-like repeat domain-containing protein [Thainema sp.]
MTSSTTDPASATDAIAELKTQFQSATPKVQLELVETLVEQGDQGLQALMDLLLDRASDDADPVDGKIYQILWSTEQSSFQSLLEANWPSGLISLDSEQGVDYQPLHDQLVEQDYELADRTTLQLMCELAGAAAARRKWLYFSEVNNFPPTDLQTIDRLWRVFSVGKFGFSVQRELWLGVGKDWDKLWPKINWKTGNRWTRYPNEFTWDLSAPRGHLPLSNQLRGVRVMESLLTHPAWTE